jgi:hypothetical protein
LGSVIQVALLELATLAQLIEQAQALLGSARHGDGGGVIERDHRGIREPLERLVQEHDPRPVGVARFGEGVTASMVCAQA